MPRVNESHLVDVLAKLRENRRHHLPALSARGELEGRLHQGPDGIGKKSSILIEALEFLSVHLLKLRLIIPGIDLTRTPIDEQPNHRLGLPSEMPLLGSERIVSSKKPLIGQQTGEPQTTQSGS